jgi:hypothetical protein
VVVVDDDVVLVDVVVVDVVVELVVVSNSVDDVGGTTVDEVLEVTVVDVVAGIDVDVVVGAVGGQSNGTGVPTAADSMASESVAVVRSSPFMSHTHTKHFSRLMAARRANSESDAIGS